MKHTLQFILLVLLLSACSLVNEPKGECPSYEPGDVVTFCFHMSTASPSTRTDGYHEEEDSEFKQLEDGIDYQNLGVFVFARLSSKPESEEKLLLKSVGMVASSDNEIYMDGAPGDYTISMDVLRTHFNEILFGKDSEQQIDPAGRDLVTLRIVMVANCNSSAESDQEIWNTITGSTFNEVISQLNDWHFEMNKLYNTSYTGNDLEGLYSNVSKSIPMFGTNVFQTTQNALHYSRHEKRILLGDIELLRALAKVRVIDNIQFKNEEGYPKISKAEFIGSQNEARPLPEDALNYKNGFQVHTPNIYEDKILTIDDVSTFRLGIMPDNDTSVSQDDKTGSVLVGYVPEQRIGYVNNDLSGIGMPGLRITVEFSPTESKEYEVPMTGYNGKKFYFGDNILRNHIYSLSVNNIIISPQMELDVVPYVGIDLQPGFGFENFCPGDHNEPEDW